MRRLLPSIVALVLLAGPLARAQARPDDARLPEARYPAIVALGDAGRLTEALTALEQRVGGTDGETPIEAQLLRARLLADAGAFHESAVLWQAIGARVTELEPLAIRKAAEEFLESGELERADALLADRSPGELGALLTRLAAGYEAAGRPQDAERLYQRVLAARPGGPVADQAALGLATALARLGRRDEALAQLTTLQRRFQDPAVFRPAREQATRLARDLGRTDPLFSDAEYRAMVERLLARSRFDEAMAVLEDWRTAFPTSGPRIDVLSIDTLYRARMNAEARRLATSFLQRHPNDTLATEARVLLFRLDVREGRTADVRVRGEALWTGRFPGLSLTDRLELGRLLAAYLVSIGAVDDGLGVYRRVFRAARSPEWQVDILWRAGVAAIRAGQLDRAATNLSAVRRRRPDREIALLAEYWTAAVAEYRGRRDAAVRGYAALARREPYHYYGIRARERLAALAAPVPETDVRLTFPDTVVQTASRATPEFRAAAWLAGAGLADDAARLARALAAARRGDRALALLAARAAAAAGQHRESIRLIETRFLEFIQRPARNVPDDFLELAYPPAFWSEVRDAAAEYATDPRLLLSLARQESRFDPSARSLAGAVGLFQLMPYTADALAPRLGLELDDPGMLTAAGVSARLAARLVADLARLFDGTETAVMAAYNAGAERGAAWWRAAAGVRDDLFVDTIPYGETRRYVRLVYANYAQYRRLYDR